jgi:hypothetical protein
VIDPELLDHVRRPYTARKRPAEDLVEFGIESADPELLEIEIG